MTMTQLSRYRLQTRVSRLSSGPTGHQKEDLFLKQGSLVLDSHLFRNRVVGYQHEDVVDSLMCLYLLAGSQHKVDWVVDM